MPKEIEVQVSDPSQGETTYVGLEICRGPGVLRLILTRPYRSAGRTMEIPLEKVKGVTPVAPAPQGEPPPKRGPTSPVSEGENSGQI